MWLDVRRVGIGLGLNAGVLERVVRRDDRELYVASHDLGRFAIALGDVVADLESRNLTRDVRREAAGVEGLDAPNANGSGEEVLPERLAPDSDGGDDADPGDDDSAHW